ncbi:ankyrin repeat domain-containing protein [Lysinibacillus irui]|uniref:Ankyrin repeat domain-containing protein n=1 Tax=Lysinibacillus irui TaxID=2998077 RepID=A0ABU5NMQ2_9BACI|nr:MULTISPECIES: ankyrin repeat domain-containing protein [Lysinibacillus]MEA0555673.1 ankyrin repeat domain-containing protein [Lysinibacillus irui]MEA0977323.1 ankyrin repeat domain-containing protein [Lysinibacillus irui]MEA1043477.1 ankyrin repeat domain-containing protein [Lysinibacillus irui]
MDDQLIINAANGNTEIVLSLLQNGVNINTTDQIGRTAVLAATYNNQVDTVRVLIEHGADINSRDNNLENVLLHAGASGYLEIVKLAIAAGADTKLTNRFGGVAIIPASERGHVEVVRELLNHSDIDVNHINHLHWTALLEAVILGNGGEKHQEVVQLLVDYGADLNIGDRDGITPLQHAKKLGFHEIVSILKNAESERSSNS